MIKRIFNENLQKAAYEGIGLIMGLSVALTPAAIASTGTKMPEAVFRNIKLVVDGKVVMPKDGNGNVVEPFVVDGTTYLPVRAVSEAVGKEVKRDGMTLTTPQTSIAVPHAQTPPQNSEGVKLSGLNFFIF